MDASAINAIRDMAVCDKANDLFAEKNVMLRPPDYWFDSLERFNDTPRRFRANFQTDNITEFCAYVNANADADTGVFVGDGKANAILDMGWPDAPQWGEHAAGLTLAQKPEFKALLDNRDKALKQLDLADFIEDTPECFVFLDAGGEPMDLGKALTGIRKLTVSASSDKTTEVGDFSESLSELDKIGFTSGGVPLPKGFRFTCEPYEGFGNAVFECRLRAVIDGNKALLKYRIMALDSQLNAIKDEFVAILKQVIKVEGAQFYQGVMAYQGKA